MGVTIVVSSLIALKHNQGAQLSERTGRLRTSIAVKDPRPEARPDLELLAREVMVTCTGAMLVCLDRPHRGRA